MLASQKIIHRNKSTKKMDEQKRQIEQMSFELLYECEKAVTGITNIDQEAVPGRRIMWMTCVMPQIGGEIHVVL